jgi:polyhydroxyalkanoate synthesis regulator phasin
MERIERRMKNLLLASIGAAAVTREQSEDLVHALIEKGEKGQRIQSPMLTRYNKGMIDEIWQWRRTDLPEE